ncbi:hypothetical protein IscW_ISCW021306, partial [Ixodes scapularis]
MELDTGTAISVLSVKQQEQLFVSLQLKETTLRLRTYTGTLVQPKGVTDVTVNTTYKGASHLCILYRAGRTTTHGSTVASASTLGLERYLHVQQT